jgi:hypothetical protein
MYTTLQRMHRSFVFAANATWCFTKLISLICNAWATSLHTHTYLSAPPLALALAETAVQTVLLVAVVWGFTEGYRAVLHHTGQSLKRSEPLPTVLSLATWGFVGELHV